MHGKDEYKIQSNNNSGSGTEENGIMGGSPGIFRQYLNALFLKLGEQYLPVHYIFFLHLCVSEIFDFY